MATANPSFKSGEEFRRQKDLEEARKAGLAPAELDEDGNEINPHIPQYMTSAPWYLNSDRPTLKHQKNWKNKITDSKQWYDRGQKVFQASKWRKGSCENCGSISHQTKDCLERPRQKGAKFTNKNIAADDKVEEIEFADWDSKRDRWNGYDAKEYSKVIDKYERVELLRKELKKKEQMEAIYLASGKGLEEAAAAAATAAAAAAAAANGDKLVDEDVQLEEDVKIGDEEDAGFSEVKRRVRTNAGGSTGSVRNLRIREDTAKYLLNLDLNSAHYDPKSRSMREDPNPEKPLSEKQFAGDNFVRKNGDYNSWQALNLHSIQAHNIQGQDVHMQAVPSLAETLYKSFKEKKEALVGKSKTEVLSKYGSAASAAPPDEALLLGQTEAYVEYDRTGRVIKGQEVKARSRYEEDVRINNHTAVWGSWWHEGVWGYACCHQCVKNSYCTGAAGEAAKAAVAAQMVKNMADKAAAVERAAAAAEAEADASEGKEGAGKEGAPKEVYKLKDPAFTADVWGSTSKPDLELDDEALRAAIKRQDQAEREAVAAADERKRGYNSLRSNDVHVTEEDMEAFRLKRARGDDPMAAFANGKAGDGGYELL